MIELEAKAVGAPLFTPWRRLHGLRRARAARLSGRGRPPRPAAPAPPRRATRSTMPGSPSPRCGGRASRLPRGAIEAGLSSVPSGRPACSGCDPARWSSWRPPGADIWLDGGHNPAAGAAIAQRLRGDRGARSATARADRGMLTTKDPAGFFRPFAGLVRHVMTVPVPDSQSGFDPAHARRDRHGRRRARPRLRGRARRRCNH